MPYKQRICIEGYGCIESLKDPGFAYNFLVSLTEVLDMRILIPPNIVKVPLPYPVDSLMTTDWGVSGFVIWMESGAQLHTWPREKLATLDAFSCKEFSIQDAIGIFDATFSPKNVKYCSPVVESHV